MQKVALESLSSRVNYEVGKDGKIALFQGFAFPSPLFIMKCDNFTIKDVEMNFE